jgi:hypothetical protein
MRFNLDNYETVESRLARFWEQYPNGQVFTQIHHYDENKVVFRAEIYKDISDPRPVATGYAEELRDASPVNRTSHVENAETSAIGRALANFIFQSKTAPRPSREEMSKVARAEQPKPQGQDLLTKFREACAKQNIDPQDVAKAAGLNFGELTDADMPKLRDAFKTLTTKPAEPPVSKQVEDAEAFIARVQEAFPTAAEVAATPQIKDPDAPASKAQIGKVRAMMSGKGIASYQDKIEKAQDLLNLPNLKQLEQLTKGQANLLINMVEEMK